MTRISPIASARIPAVALSPVSPGAGGQRSAAGREQRPAGGERRAPAKAGKRTFLGGLSTGWLEGSCGERACVSVVRERGGHYFACSTLLVSGRERMRKPLYAGSSPAAAADAANGELALLVSRRFEARGRDANIAPFTVAVLCARLGAPAPAAQPAPAAEPAVPQAPDGPTAASAPRRRAFRYTYTPAQYVVSVLA